MKLIFDLLKLSSYWKKKTAFDSFMKKRNNQDSFFMVKLIKDLGSVL